MNKDSYIIILVAVFVSGIILGIYISKNSVSYEEQLKVKLEKKLKFLDSKIIELKGEYLRKLAITLKEYLGCCVKDTTIYISIDNKYFYYDTIFCESDVGVKKINLKNTSIYYLKEILRIGKIYRECLDEVDEINPPFDDPEVESIYYKLLSIRSIENKLAELKERYRLGEILIAWEEARKLEEELESFR